MSRHHTDSLQIKIVVVVVIIGDCVFFFFSSFSFDFIFDAFNNRQYITSFSIGQTDKSLLHANGQMQTLAKHKRLMLTNK